MRVLPLGFPNEALPPPCRFTGEVAVHGCETALASLRGRQATGSRGVRGYRKYSSLMSAQETKTPFEVGCCDSRFDENPTSSGSADEYIPSKTILTVISTDLAHIQWLSGQCMPAFDRSRKNADLQPRASTLDVECVCFYSVPRMRHSNLAILQRQGSARA
jgi:hypothetical protein